MIMKDLFLDPHMITLSVMRPQRIFRVPGILTMTIHFWAALGSKCKQSLNKKFTLMKTIPAMPALKYWRACKIKYDLSNQLRISSFPFFLSSVGHLLVDAVLNISFINGSSCSSGKEVGSCFQLLFFEIDEDIDI